jgi:hypothetical protein
MLHSFKAKSRFLVIEQVVSPNHLETSLDIALQLAEQGHEVRYVHMGAVLPHIEFKRNPIIGLSLLRWGRGLLSDSYMKPVRKGLTLSQGLSQSRGLCTKFFMEDAKIYRNWRPPRMPFGFFFGSLRSLKNRYFANLPVGSSIASSLVSRTRSSKAIPLLHPLTLAKIWRAFWIGHRAFELHGKGWADYVVVFNGRFAFSKGAELSASESKIPSLFHERGGSDNKGFFFEQFQTHDNSKRGQYFSDLWNRNILNDELATFSKAQEFLEQKYASTLNSRENYTRRQKTGLKRASLEEDSYVFFASSDDETVSLGSLAPESDFSDQRDAIRTLINLCDGRGKALVVRVHPNIATKSFREQLWWSNLNPVFWKRSVRLFGARNSVSSYELIDNAKAVVVWRSSIAHEAVFLGKPVITLSEASFLHCGLSAVTAASEQALQDALEAETLLEPEKSSALPFAHGLFVSKNQFKWYEPLGSNQGFFLGVNLFDS